MPRPGKFREEKGNSAERHLRNCGARSGGDCDKGCSAFFQQSDAHARGTPEERHDDEERRLAHVAATRAKDRLIFLSVQPAGSAAGGKGRGGGKGAGGGRGGGGSGGSAVGGGRGGREERLPQWEPSSYEQQLAQLPAEVFVTKVLER